MSDELVDVAIVGAGISGLAAAYELRKRKRSVVVLEREQRPGGVILTERIGEFVVDAGPDALLVQKPGAVALCNELGLGDRLFPTKLPRTAFVLRDGELHALPSASILGFPTRLKTLFTTTLLGVRAKVRMAAELFIPKAAGTADESIGAFVRRRFGSEAVTYIAEPLLAGIHAGDVERLSMRTLFPRLIEAEAKAGSIIKAFRREPRPVNSDGVFRSFPNGIAELVDGLMKAVPKESVRCGANVTRIEETDTGFAIHVAGRPSVRAKAVILAIPAFAAAELLRPLDASLADACASIRYL
ncbi:MAG TPA: protoporphyrinogen oxidase, partial [Vicinamibacterales bacterium]|nr:protoporphyrinogen oxidase [Vicinamibacterales bacterium]